MENVYFLVGDLEVPGIVITEPDDTDISYPPSNISDSSVNSYHTAPINIYNIEGYPTIYLPDMQHFLDSIDDPTNQLYPPANHLPVIRSRSMDELSSQQNALEHFAINENNNINKWHSTGNLENHGNWYYPPSGGSSMSSLGQDDFMKIFKSEILSDSGDESIHSDYIPPANMYTIPSMINPHDMAHMAMSMNNPSFQQSHSLESETDSTLYIDVNPQDSNY